MASIGQGGVKVKGLDELRRELKKLDAAAGAGIAFGEGGSVPMAAQLGEVNYDVASSIIGPAKAKAASVGRMEARAAATLSASKSTVSARVMFGGAKAPFAGGAEFGAGQNRPRSTARGTVQGWNQFNPWRGNGGDAGYFLYPTIRERTPDIVEMYGDAIEKITAQAFPD